MAATEQLAEDLLGMWRRLRRTNIAARPGEITPEQFVLLRYLHVHESGSASIGEIALALGVTQSAATTACQRLEKAGLVTRTRDDDDERIVRVAITAVGCQQLDAWRQQTRAALLTMLHPLTPEEQAELQRLLRKVMDTRNRAPSLLFPLSSIVGLASSVA